MIEEGTFFDWISIKLASPQVIRGWSSGEVKKAETLNYRTLKPEKDGLFCERIFGPAKDWECHCGKLKGIKFKGTKCDRCGVEILHSSVRRQRMGHIELAAPVTHIWFFKVLPSRIGAVLDLSIKQLEKIIYYEEYVVTDPGTTKLKKMQLLNEEEYLKAKEEYGTDFTALIGGEAIKKLLEESDLDKLNKSIRKSIDKGKIGLNKRFLKRLKIIEDIRRSGNKSEWMILDYLPVIPPDLRPLVPLEGGRFASSDLNDLYRRVINRNNRLKKLMALGAPDIIVKNEKRMLQEAVDAVIENGRHGRPVVGPQNRPLKSLSDMLKGKQGRFRQNLLGKRVDYSGRSVIVVGPELKLHECGIPKQMALELVEPFIIKKLREKGFVHTIKGARRMVERARVEVWDILEDVIRGHPVLLNRAPTLHRLSIQAFYPLLVEGKAIKLHPLVCAAFNADFDGDQMAVHLPLSLEAQAEARLIMLSVNNIFSPSDGRPVIVPSQDMIIGCRYLTLIKDKVQGEKSFFSNIEEVITAYQDEELDLHAKIKLRINDSNGVKKIIETTTGRVIFNQILPKGFRFVNELLGKSSISEIINECYKKFGHAAVVELLDKIKDLGFEYATLGGVSISIDDLNVPKEKEECIQEASLELNKVDEQYRRGIITERERHNKIIDVWTRTTDRVSDLVFKNMDHNNPVFMMADSGARGSRLQVRQLAGMRGLMAKPSGEIIEIPIISNFKEGLSVLEYFISTHGARKGLADTALKTADAGYLTRRLVDVAQEVIAIDEDCGTVNGITVSEIVEGEEVVVSLTERIIGRIALDNIVDVVSDEVIAKSGEEITEEKAEKIESLGLEKIRIRSVLTCETARGVCVKCYGRNLAARKLVEIGEAVGVIAAQSIGEPGTQLTMRTFHIGGTASRVAERAFMKARAKGIVKYHNIKVVSKGKYFVVLNRNGMISLSDEKGIEIQRNPVPQGAMILAAENETVDKDKIFIRWDPYSSPILGEVGGKVKYEDIMDKITIQEEMNVTTGRKERVIIEFKGDYHPQILILSDKEEVLGIYPLPTGAHIMVEDGSKIEAGDIIAKTPRLVAKTRDITGGLPRVAELFEARRPKNPAVVSEIDGFIEFAEEKGERKIIVRSTTGMKREYLIPPGVHPIVYRGDHAVAGQQLTEGPVVLQDILRVCGDKVLQEQLVNEIQEIYRLQGVKINDKHIEIIIREMLKKVKIVDPGDTEFLPGEGVDKWDFRLENEKVIKKNGKPATAAPLLLGITKASLSTKSFISAASFQETTRILSEAAIAGKIDSLQGLKENVIVGHLIPAGTGLKKYREIEVEKCQQ